MVMPWENGGVVVEGEATVRSERAGCFLASLSLSLAGIVRAVALNCQAAGSAHIRLKSL